MTNRKYITLTDEEQEELKTLLERIKAKKDLVDDLADKIRAEKNVLWSTIFELYPEVEGKRANYQPGIGKISYETDVMDELARASENVEQLKLLRKLRKSGKISNEVMLDILEVLNFDE